MRNHGFIYRAPKPEDYANTGAIKLGGPVLTPSGQWDDFIPEKELQNRSFEPMACASYGTLNAVEILEKKLYGTQTNWSDRFLARQSGTTQYGNDPHTVAETLRKDGDVYESDWPYPTVKTWEEFYKKYPYQLEVDAVVKFKGKYNFGHQYVDPSPKSMMEELKYSPLGVDVDAWNERNGIYVRNNKSNHWCVCYGYVEGQYWKIVDTYDNTSGSPFKKLDWKYGFFMVKRYTLDKQILKNDLWSRAIRYLQQFL